MYQTTDDSIEVTAILAEVVKHLRTNLFIAAWALILFAVAITAGLPGPGGLTIAAPAGLIGCGMLIWAIGMREEPKPMSDFEIARWTPDSEVMSPGAGGSVMYRVDTTLDSPIRTSILCGACGHVEWVDGKRPRNYSCVACGRWLWEQEEE
ncbi:MAG: hypothetical protein VYC11_00560 [Candidatus Thermoplasmatota archaeon]|nr:hypothetical protein [Candidatus Thermoplasmatota archaeon]